MPKSDRMKPKKSLREIEIQQACAWCYQICGSMFWGGVAAQTDVGLHNDDKIVMDILSAIASGEKIPHRARWRVK